MSRWNPFTPSPPFVAVIRLEGAIGSGPRGLADKGLADLVDKAFSKGKPKAVAIEINSPGGSPVQSSLIGARIRRLSAEKKVPVVAFVEDVAASGGYWLASAADEIFVDASSLVGSIGVVSAGFGAQDLIGRWGIERRVHTAGDSKSFLDPFRPEKPQDIERLERWLGQIHETFIAQVRDRRGGKLADHPELFTGEVWIGAAAVEVGLADAIGHLVPEMKRRYGSKVAFRRYARRRPLLQRFGAQIVDQAIGAVEDRAAFARFGL